jgi:hypothetical protein
MDRRLPTRSMVGALRRNLAVAVVVTLAALAVSACRSQPPPQPVTVLFVDLTRSAADREGSMLADFRTVLDQVASEHGRLLADVIDGNPLAHARIAIDQSFAVPEAQGNRLVERRTFAERRSAAVAAMSALLYGSRPARSTDVFGAVVSGAQRLQSVPRAGLRRLVFLSDMISTTRPYNLLAHRWDRPAVNRLIADLRAKHMLPSLVGVDVWVAGAGLSSTDGPPAATLMEIKALWLAVFTATGARVTVYAPQLVASGRPIPPTAAQPLMTGA